ncbi:MAG TPA: iron transporter [Selenomonadales bacterium]|nr:iron transporter [Selenomonadales bacterium]
MKKKMYLVLMIVLVSALAVFASGCGSSQTAKPAETKPEAADKAAADKAAAPDQAKGFEEFPIGEEQEMEGLKIAAVYFQPVTMEPAGTYLPPDKADFHLEADISATEDNKTGFGVGDFVPNLTVKYKITKKDDGQVIEGNFMPMNATDGPHYGANVKLLGAGKYEVMFIIESPEKQGFLLHTDKETGVPGRFWTKPLEVKWDFDFIPRKW